MRNYPPKLLGKPHERTLARIGLFVFFTLVLTAITTVVFPTRPSSGAVALSSHTVTRTSTPTRTATLARTVTSRVSPAWPVSVRMAGQPQVDADTIALYHFDAPYGSYAIDATGNYTGTLHGQATIGTGQYYGGLQLDGIGSYVRTGYLGPMPRGTIEAFVDFRSACTATHSYFNIFTAGPEYGNGTPVMRFFVDLMLDFEILTQYGWVRVSSSINPCRYLNQPLPPGSYYWATLTPPPNTTWPYDVWRYHHVAATWGERGMEIWVDGVLHGIGSLAATPVYCNPQNYLGSVNYPIRCDSPKLGDDPLGAYKGGLPAYSTFLIGCGSDGNCMQGIVDEVRISRVQRTFAHTILPTSTPTPTNTPVVSSGEYSVDENTLALFHLNTKTRYNTPNSVISDPQRDGVFYGEAPDRHPEIVPGIYNNALHFKGIDSLFGVFLLGDPRNGTLETWVNLYDVTDHWAIASAGGNYAENWNTLFLGVDRAINNNLRFGLFGTDNQWHWIDSGLDASYFLNVWRHIAVTWGSRGMELWVDGVIRGTNPFTGQRYWNPYPNTGGDYHLFGCDARKYCMRGLLDEIRISTIQRTFAPIATATPTNTPAPTPTWAPFTPTVWFWFPFVSR